MSFEERLKQYAQEIGIDAIGITTAEPFLGALVRLKKMQDLGYLSPWAEQDLEKRCEPHRLMEEAQSIIAVGLAYPMDAEEISHQENVLRGKLARFAQYQDYHQVLRKKMEELVCWIRREYSAVKAEIYVDTGPLLDREVAYRAGIGFIGKNSALIHPELGSFLALGEILLNLPLKSDQPLDNGCGKCTLCLKACPQQVIKAPGEIETKRCLAHYTQEKGILPDLVKENLGNRLWGCDTCQEICPYNHKVHYHCRQKKHQIWKEHGLGAKPDLKQVIQLTNRKYQELVGGSAMAWRGKTTLQRNALINLGNSRDLQAIPIIEEALRDQRSVIQATAVWAIDRIKKA